MPETAAYGPIWEKAVIGIETVARNRDARLGFGPDFRSAYPNVRRAIVQDIQVVKLMLPTVTTTTRTES